MAYFTPTVLPMVAVANIWLFFYTPQYGLIAQVMQLFGAPGPNWLGDRATALPALMLVTVWKEAGFFMIFYLAALQTVSPARGGMLEGASRWQYFRRVLWPLLMPTTLFVLINALINAFRLVDHVVVMTKGGPTTPARCCCTTSTRWVSASGTPPRRHADRGAAGGAGADRADQVPLAGPQDALPMKDKLDTLGAWALGLLWILPLAYAMWAAFHPPAYATRFDLFAPLTLDNFVRAWNAAPFPRYFLNTFLLVTMVLAAQLVLSTLAGYAFARFEFRGRDFVFMLVLLQLMIMPDVLLVENYRSMSQLGIRDTVFAIGLPYFASAFGIFLLRQTFKTVPRELEEAARMEGANALQVLMKVYVPLAKPIYVAYGLVSVSHHWNNFLWPLIITNSVESRPLTVGLQVFSSTDQGIDWSVITAATLMSAAPLLIAFLLFQRQFVQSFMRAGIR